MFEIPLQSTASIKQQQQKEQKIETIGYNKVEYCFMKYFSYLCVCASVYILDTHIYVCIYVLGHDVYNVSQKCSIKKC